MLLADVPDMAGWPSLLASAVNVGFSIVVGLYLLTKALPKMQQDFRDELKEERTSHIGIIKDVVTAFKAEVEIVRSRSDLQVDKLAQEIQHSRDTIHEAMEVITRLENRFNTTWDFLIRRGMVEAKQKGLVEHEQ
jgi:hypothetical protein